MTLSPTSCVTPGGTPSRRVGIVIACQREDGRWLMVRRSAMVERAPLKIGFPGGEVEPGETQPQAVVREAMEEVGIIVRPVCCVWEYDWPNSPWYLYGWLAQWTSGVPVPNPHEVAEILWLTADEGAEHPDALPTMRSLCTALERVKHVPAASDSTRVP